MCELQRLGLDKSGREFIKLEFILKLKKKHNDFCLQTRVCKQPIIALYFEFENELKFYSLEAKCICLSMPLLVAFVSNSSVS